MNKLLQRSKQDENLKREKKNMSQENVLLLIIMQKHLVGSYNSIKRIMYAWFRFAE